MSDYPRAVAEAILRVQGEQNMPAIQMAPFSTADLAMLAHAYLSLVAERDGLRGALRDFVHWFDVHYPEGQSENLPGVNLWSIAKAARAALSAQQGEG